MINTIKNKTVYFATHHRAKAKTLTWRVTASTDTFLLGVAILAFVPLDSAAALAGMIATGEIFTKLILYWGHEKLWQRVPHLSRDAGDNGQKLDSSSS